MVHGPPTLAIDDVLALVRRAGGRVTAARRAVIATLLAGSEEHLTAEDVAERVQRQHPDVHLSTVYRTLDALEDLGVTTHVHLGHGPSTFHLTSDPHHHAVCDGCGAVVHLPADLFDGVAARMRTDIGFELTAPHFSLPGRCADCVSAG
ncbi:MAG: Fur family transcriptional regulator, partial [Acidimicrobiales bacterium]